MEDGRLSIDSQAHQGYQGEVILNVSQESTYVLDAVSGIPTELSDIKDRGYHLCLYRSGNDHEPSANDKRNNDLY